MKKPLVILALIAAFAVLVAYALLGELKRDKQLLAQSVSGTVEVRAELFATGAADIIKTDRLALFLVDPATNQPVALKFESPLVPPMNIRIGQEDVRDGKPLTGSYLLIGITDKDGEVFKVSPGEVWGRLETPVKLGDTHVRLVLDQPFRGALHNGAAPGAMASAGPLATSEEDPKRTIRGTVRAAPALAKQVAPEDRLIVMLFDPEAGRPAAVKIVPNAKLPQPFAIGLPPGAPAKAGYQLRILTDKD